MTGKVGTIHNSNDPVFRNGDVLRIVSVNDTVLTVKKLNWFQKGWWQFTTALREWRRLG